MSFKKQYYEENDATVRVVAQPAQLYLSAVAEQQARANDATEKVLPQSAQSYIQALVESPAEVVDNDLTIRVPGRKGAHLYKQLRAQREKPDSLSTATSAGSVAPEQKKRSRRTLLALLHLVADMLLLALLIFACIAVYLQYARMQRSQHDQQHIHQAQQYVQQQQKTLQRLGDQKYAAQVQHEARALVQQFHQEASSWGQAHLYHDTYDRHQYALDSGYMQPGIGGLIDKDLAEARTTIDFENIVSETQYGLFNLHMLEADYTDTTPYNQVHASDLRMLEQYHLDTKMVLMVSLVGQAMRVYQQGKLVQAFAVTTGRFERPSLPGVWKMLDRQSPSIFVSADPPGSPYWFPNTPISYALLYHQGGFFVHDAPWRVSYGPGTQFPHQDASGNTAYNFDGSHGCINLKKADMAWVYQHTDWNSVIVIY